MGALFCWSFTNENQNSKHRQNQILNKFLKNTNQGNLNIPQIHDIKLINELPRVNEEIKPK